MDFFKALNTPRTVSEIAKATGLSRGGVIQSLRRNKKLVKKVGSKREHERGPESNLYKLRAGAKPKLKKTKKRQLDLGFVCGADLVPQPIGANGVVPSEAAVSAPADAAPTEVVYTSAGEALCEQPAEAVASTEAPSVLSAIE